MGELIHFPTRMPKGGGCPRCGTNDGFLNDGPDHWFICIRHWMKWYGGRNVLAGWKRQDDEYWDCNRRALASMKEVKPRDWKLWKRP